MGLKIMTTEEFKQKVYDEYGDKVEILSDYNGGTSPIKFVYHCEKHGDTHKTINAKNILSKSFSPCKECTRELKSFKGKNIVFDNKEYYYNRLKECVESKGGQLITKEWTTAKSLYEIHCGNPEHPNFLTNADKVLNTNNWCPYCCGRKGDFENEIKQIIENKNGELLSEYKTSQEYVSVRCKEHNYIWDIKPLNLKKGRWCPICNLPYSEKVVYDYLINNKYNIRVQYGFDDLVGENKELLRYDFAVLDENNKLLCMIEVDDPEHRYNPKQPEKAKARIRDKIKDEYCKDNEIKLFRLQYENRSKNFKNYNWYYDYIDNNLRNFLIKHTR
jgi:hypothetical protein